MYDCLLSQYLLSLALPETDAFLISYGYLPPFDCRYITTSSEDCVFESAMRRAASDRTDVAPGPEKPNALHTFTSPDAISHCSQPAARYIQRLDFSHSLSTNSMESTGTCTSLSTIASPMLR